MWGLHGSRASAFARSGAARSLRVRGVWTKTPSVDAEAWINALAFTCAPQSGVSGATRCCTATAER